MVEKKITLKLRKYTRERLHYFGSGVVLDFFENVSAPPQYTIY